VAKKKKREGRVWIKIMGKDIDINDLGPAADMDLSEGLQYLIDQGVFGQEYIGQHWSKHLEVDFNLTPRPNSGMAYEAWKALEDQRVIVYDKEKAGTATEDDRQLFRELEKKFQIIDKLTKE
jgi:hypothetical protein